MGNDFEEGVEDIVRELFFIEERMDPELPLIFQEKTKELEEEPEEICCICLEYIKGSQALLVCRHSFHLTCIYSWLDTKRVCPSCRMAIKWEE
ncbi:uncharacterized protein Eint_110870 [Encephalitozoon intestinalis ATCC 50506]|uniref:RING-type domain-containing protein n=1 Tax=Encephalitozoon intestinalis (strain ATCC 50506) TaxID=876142 RepID=E0SAG2_ENCIT|nr:uncharacterized protein Eint_110870 [Encephalitozoon intestinalis ATCC 50506]ADM12587.1 hypothetical protein Eint_110870 [Encephalitozoon intestinalis ATCC 50506]UTX46444.1 RING-type domain-containing protein [Encephalitozoon intestinalis]